jgi:ProP effector
MSNGGLHALCHFGNARANRAQAAWQRVGMVHGLRVCQRSGALEDNHGLFKLIQAMTDTLTDTPLPPTDSPAAAMPPSLAPNPPATKSGNRFAAVAPVLEKLFELYPHLFGQRFLPLKLGVFQDLLAAHPEVFKRDTLKSALGVHTRSTRYLQSVAAGNKRYDLQGNAVDDVAPEHVFLSVLELFQRRQARTQDNLQPRLRTQLVAAYQAAGLSRQDYLSRLPTLEDTIAALLDDAIAEVDQQRARHVALSKAFHASGKTVDEFAAALGQSPAEILAALQQI